MLSVRAKVYFKPEEQGGHPRAFSGIQPSMEIGKELVACKVLAGEIGSPIELGCWTDVTIELAYGEMFQEDLKPGFQFKLKIGSWEIGNGHIKVVPGKC